MINKSDLASALLNTALIVAKANGINFVAEGEAYEPEINTEYIKESVLYSNDNSLGMEAESSDIMRGIYQLNVYIPKINPTNRFRGLDIIALIQTEFAKASIILGYPLTTIEQVSISQMIQNDTHTYHAVSIRFSAIG